ncbi:50S ribosomal protein L21 [Patescibacteria group bacterium]
MSKYAVIKIQGHQYQVSEKDEILVDKITNKVEPEVLLYVDDGKVKIGKPNLKDVTVKIKKIEDLKGDKIMVFKYKSKSRYRKKRGFRPQYTKLLIEKISSK